MMKARLRTIVAALVCLAAGAPALAQQTQANTAAPAQNGVVGPTQLQNFSLTGNVTRPASTPPERQAPQRQTAAPRPAPATAGQDKPAAASSRRAEAPPVAQPPRREAAPQVETSAPPSTEPLLPPTDSVSADTVPAAPVTAVPETGGRMPILPWIIAALALAGAAAWFFFRQRPRERFAGDDDGVFDLPAPAPPASPPAPAPKTGNPAPQSAAPVPSGVVSTRLRPWLEIELKPERAIVDDQKAAVAFELSVYNSGSVPARAVVLEATLFNAGPVHHQQIQLFFDNPVGKGDPIPVIMPMKRATVNTTVFLPRDQVRPIEIEGRALFVPIIAVNALYSSTGTKAQTSASYIVGKETGGEKLAPFRVDLGPRIFRGLAAREHELKLRK
jgi:hypothetical protein